MSELLGVIALFTGFLAFFWEVSLQLIPKEKKRNYTLGVVAIYLFIVVLMAFNIAKFTAFYVRYTDEILIVLLLATIALMSMLAVLIRSYRVSLKFCNERIMVKEYFEGDSTDRPMSITVDGRRHSGNFYFNGRCFLLPAGKYKVTADPANPGGWSAWNRDNLPNLKSYEGPWTWNLLISIPGISDDFRDVQYYPIQSFEKAWRMGRWQNSWVFPSKNDITYSSLVNKGFVVEFKFELEYTSPVWFWIWDHKPSDNRGEVNLLLFKLK